MARRVILVSLIFCEQGTVQMISFRVTVLLVTCYILHFRPHLDPANHRLETIHESFLLVHTVLMVCYTEFLGDPYTRQGVGKVSFALLVL